MKRAWVEEVGWMQYKVCYVARTFTTSKGETREIVMEIQPYYFRKSKALKVAKRISEAPYERPDRIIATFGE